MTRLSSARALLLALLPVVFALAACDSGGSSEDDVNNQFSFTITPAPSSSNTLQKQSPKDLNGYSFFVDTEDIAEVDDEAFVIYFSGNESFSEANATSGLFGFAARNSGQPETGSFDITDGLDGSGPSSKFLAWLYEDVENTQQTPHYFFQNGTLSLSTSSDEKVSGQLSGTAIEYIPTASGVQTDTVEISGSFSAKDLDTYVPFGNYAGN
jgi:hypothetical protein